MHHRRSEDGTAPPSSVRNGSRQRGQSTDDNDPAIVAAEQRCHIRLRYPPSHSCCLFCPVEFEGPGSWEERMEHIGRHLEQHKREDREAPAVGEWRCDRSVETWLQCEGLIVRVGNEWQLAEGRRGVR